MNDELFIGLVKQLKQAREEQNILAATKKEMEAKFAQDPKYIHITEGLMGVSGHVSKIEKLLKSLLIDDPAYTPPFKAAWLIDTTNVEIDDSKALAWAKINMAAAVSEIVDKKMLTDFAKKNPTVAPYATITECKDARIASDLGKFTEVQ